MILSWYTGRGENIVPRHTCLIIHIIYMVLHRKWRPLWERRLQQDRPISKARYLPPAQESQRGKGRLVLNDRDPLEDSCLYILGASYHTFARYRYRHLYVPQQQTRLSYQSADEKKNKKHTTNWRRGGIKWRLISSRILLKMMRCCIPPYCCRDTSTQQYFQLCTAVSIEFFKYWSCGGGGGCSQKIFCFLSYVTVVCMITCVNLSRRVYMCIIQKYHSAPCFVAHHNQTKLPSQQSVLRIIPTIILLYP